MGNKKRGRFGFKNYCGNEDSGYCFASHLYAGKGSIVPRPCFSITETVVLNLVEKLSDRGHIVTVDSGYGTVKLADALDKKGFGVLAAANPRRMGFPEELKPEKKDKKTGQKKGLKLSFGETKALQSESGIVVLAFRDNKMVYHITNCEDISTTEKTKVKRGGERVTYQRPNMNTTYSKLMKGTDVMNQRESYYTGEKRSARPYKKGSTHYLHMLENNAHQISLKDGKKWTALQFRKQIVNSLTQWKPKKDVLDGLHLPQGNAAVNGRSGMRCSFCGKTSQIHCDTCLNRKGGPVVLCPKSCFKEYHHQLWGGGNESEE